MRRSGLFVVTLFVLASGLARAGTFTTFESGQVRPLALSPDGSRLFAVNTPDGQLEIFAVDGSGLTHTGSVPVGLEPVAVAARTNGEVWVVNHLSDSVSIVDVSGAVPRVTRTLLVGDEPRDIVFAGSGGSRAFITTAHRGQQRTNPAIASAPGAGDPEFTTPTVGRADVWVFDANDPGTVLGGMPVGIVTLFGDTPRALAASADGATVYAAVFKSGNQTTTISEGAVCDGFGSAVPCTNSQGLMMPGGVPGPSTDSLGERAPETGIIVKFDPPSGQWHDTLGRDWSQGVRFTLPDDDVFAIDASSLAQTATFTGVGTVLFNMVVNPVSGALYVSNTEARNERLFEGPGTFGGSTVQGHLAEARITILSGSSVLPRRLNNHIDYSLPVPAGTKDHSLATPVGMAVSPDGATLYVAAFGSSKIGVVDTNALFANAFDATSASANYIGVTGGGPSGLVLDAVNHRLYVLTRFDDAVSVVDLLQARETAHLPLHNPEPASVVVGRPFLYDAVNTSSNGEASCASCHIFGDMDDLAWNLGNPDDAVKPNPIPINLAIAVTAGVIHLPTPINGTGNVGDFHPMKGPMTTQTLRGLKGSGAMHWRGDRATPPGTAASAFDEVNSFNNFNGAFVSLVGRDTQIDPADMQKFTDFALQIILPPNPNRALDNSLADPPAPAPSQQRGRDFFMGPRRADGLANDAGSLQLGFTCNGCHELDPAEGEFGTSKHASFENEEQIVKIPHLRNLYQKIGMFGVVDIPIADQLNVPFQGPQIRGFGFLHDGSVDTIFGFLHARVFSDNFIGGSAVGFQSDQQRRDVEQFLLAFDSNLAPVVGQQITLGATNAGVVGPRIDLLMERAGLGECDLTVKGILAGEARGWYELPGGLFQSDRVLESPVTDAALRLQAMAPGQELTYTCVPPGSGQRVGVDRDEDGYFDRDELDAGSDPADAASVPSAPPAFVLVPTTSLSMKEPGTKRSFSFKSATATIAPPARGAGDDPTTSGGSLTIYGAGGTTDAMTVSLPASGWSALGTATKPKGFRFVDKTATPTFKVDVRPGQIKVKGKGDAAGWAYTLDEPTQGSVAVRVVLGGGTGWCADAPPKEPTTDRVGRFLAHGAPAPVACPQIP